MDTKAFVQDTVSRSLNKYLELHPDGGVPVGGTEGQTLVKTSDADGEVGWADVMTQDALDNRTLTPSGWGVAKTGVVRIDLPGNDGVGVNVDLTDLNFASVDDYNIVVTQCGGNAAWGKTEVYCSKESPTLLSIGAYKAESGSSYVEVSYVVVAKGYGGTHFVDGTGLPVGGEGGQILTKIGNEDGVVDWGFDNGANLVKFGRKYGVQPAQTLMTTRVSTEYTNAPTNPKGSDLASSCRRFRIPVGGELQNVNSILNGGLLSRYDLYVTFEGYGERAVTSGFGSVDGYGYAGASVSGSARLFYVCAETSTIENGFILLDVIVANSSNWRQTNSVTQLRFVAKSGYNFGTNEGTEPYDIRNLTGMVLDDLKITGNAVPTDWGIATVTKTSISIPSGNSATKTIDISGFGFENVDDYIVSCNIYSGAGDWANVAMHAGNKSTTSFMLIAKPIASNVTRVDVEYAIFAKGYGNTTMSAPNAILESPNGTKYKLIVADDGTLSTEAA